MKKVLLSKNIIKSMIIISVVATIAGLIFNDILMMIGILATTIFVVSYDMEFRSVSDKDDTLSEQNEEEQIPCTS